jgi:hypothetical protein
MSGRKKDKRYAAPVHHESLPHFDPRPAARVAASILRKVGAPHAIIGRVAMWTYLPPEHQEFTKDVDFAVPAEFIAAIEAEVRRRKLGYRQLQIGDIGVRDGDVRLDFIDRRLHHAALFREAIDAARRSARVVSVGRVKLPLVPVEYLVAMKMVSGEPKDDGDVKRLLEHVKMNYRDARKIVARHLGSVTADRLDVFAREAGRPEVPRRRKYES